MADTSNLTTFLGDVADAIREKKGTQAQIPAANFDTEIMSIEAGTDTSDATATANDILNPKTAYISGGKVTGAMIPTYEVLADATFTVTDPDSIIYAGQNLFYSLIGTTFTVYKNENSTLVTKATVNITTFGAFESDGNSVSIAKNGYINAMFKISDRYEWAYVRYDDSTETISLISEISYGNNRYSRPRTAVFPNLTNDYVVFYGCNYTDTNSVEIYELTSSGASLHQSVWSGETHGYYPDNLHFAHNDTLLVYDRALLDQPDTKCPYYWNVSVDYMCSNESTNSTSLVGSRISNDGTIGYKGSDVYNITYDDNNKPIFSLATTTDKTIYGVIEDTKLLQYLGSDYYITDLNNNTILGPSLIINQARDFSSITKKESDTLLKYILNGNISSEGVLVQIERSSIDYFYPHDANITSGDVCVGKIAYNSDGKVTGTFPLTQDGYSECLELSKEILGYPSVELAYLESTGSQWINTGINGADVWYVEFKFTPITKLNPHSSYIGSYIDDFTLGGFVDLNKVYLRYRTGEAFSQWTVSTTEPNTLTISDGKVTLNSQETSLSTSNSISQSNTLIYIFNNSSSGDSRPSAMRFYSLKLYDNSNNLLADIIPVLDADNVPCAWDRVRKLYLYNIGTGDFTYSLT